MITPSFYTLSIWKMRNDMLICVSTPWRIFLLSNILKWWVPQDRIQHLLKNSCYVTTAPTINVTVNVIETDFRKIFHKYQYDDSVVFAHCISADLHNSKGLSAGVATVFKKQFGKSKKQDCITDHLSYLKVHSGASVYGLISKRLKRRTWEM